MGEQQMIKVLYIDMPERIIAVVYEDKETKYIILNSKYDLSETEVDKIENSN